MMKLYKYIAISIIILIQLYSCTKYKKNEIDVKNEDKWKIETSLKKIDTSIHIINNIIPFPKYNYSGNGNILSIDSTILIYDNLFHTITLLNDLGEILYQNGGLNKSINYNKFTMPYSITTSPNGYVSIFGREIALIDYNFEIQLIKKIEFIGGEKLSSMLAIPNANNMTVYELNERNKNYFQISNKEVVVSIESEAPAFNPYNSLIYFKKARPFGIINSDNFKITPIPITRSSVYKDSCCLSVQDAAYLIKKDSLFYIQFAADSLIYVYNQKYIQKYAFGLSSKFHPNRIYNNGLEIAFDREKYLKLESRANLIESLFLFKNELICRIVNNNSKKKKYLQMFEGFDLIYETEIPYNFKYIGQNGSSIYGILKENDNQIKLCKLKQL